VDVTRRFPILRLLGVLTVVGATFVATACVDQPAPDKAAYVEAADDICDEADDDIEDEIEDLLDEIAAAREGEEATLNVTRRERWTRSKIIPIYERMDSRLRSLRPPEGDHAYLGDVYDDLSRLIVEFNSKPSRGRAVVRDDEDLRNRFEANGMRVCGRV